TGALKTEKFHDVKGPDDAGRGHMLIELRWNGCYTVVPPGVHESGEAIEWAHDPHDPMPIDPKVVRDMVADDATAALLARHWPESGGRHEMIGPLAGFLCRADRDAVSLISIAATIAGDPDVADRVAYARSTVAKFRNGEPVTGGKTLEEYLGPAVVK